MLAGYRWPGNVRELANAMERVALFSDTEEITAAIARLPRRVTGRRRDDAGASPPPARWTTPLRARIEAGAARATGATSAARRSRSGISRNTLRARMDKYGLRSQDPAPSSAARGARPSPVQGDGSAPTQWERRHLAFLRVRLLAASAVDVARVLEMVGDKVRAFGGRHRRVGPHGRDRRLRPRAGRQRAEPRRPCRSRDPARGGPRAHRGQRGRRCRHGHSLR